MAFSRKILRGLQKLLKNVAFGKTEVWGFFVFLVLPSCDSFGIIPSP